MMKKILPTTFLLLNLQVVMGQIAPLYEQVTDNQPEIGVKTEVYLGDRMLIQRDGEYRECIVPKNAYLINAQQTTFTIKAKQALCKRYAGSDLYHANYHIVGCADEHGETLACAGAVRLFEKKGKYEIHICRSKPFSSGFNCYRKLQIKGIDRNDLETNDHYFIYNENTFQQSIEYAGRNDDNLKFFYSEFTGGFARPAFNREFQVDYSQGNVAAYKGAIIEIHGATNTNIVYSVIRNFRD